MKTQVWDLIERIQAMAAGLDRVPVDTIEFDKYLGDLDLLLYELRTLTIPPKGVKAYSLRKPEGIHEALKELFGE